MSYPSTFVDLKNEVVAKLRLDATADAGKVADWVNQAYGEVVVETEAYVDFDEMALVSGSNVYLLPTSISRIKQMYVTPTSGQDSRPLEPTSLEQLLEWNSSSSNSTSSGGVTHYALLGMTDIQFWPTPAAADVVTIYYVKLPVALSADTDTPILQEPYATECLVNGACFKAAVFLKDPDAALFKQLYDQSIQKFRAHIRRREGSMTKQFRITRGKNPSPSDLSVDIRGW